MEILPGMEAIGLALYLKKERILAIGDVHMGYEEALNKQGILIPRTQFKEAMMAAKAIFEKARPETIVLMGDLKHEFGMISNQEWDDATRFLDYLLSKSRVVLLRGNHDTILGPIATKKNLEIKDWFTAGSYFFCHGDKITDIPELRKAKTIIIGHEHPAIGIRDGARVERYKCFLLGRFKRKNLLVLPSFNFVVEGTDVMQERLLSPYLSKIDEFEAFVVSDKTYAFGKIGKLRKLGSKPI